MMTARERVENSIKVIDTEKRLRVVDERKSNGKSYFTINDNITCHNRIVVVSDDCSDRELDNYLLTLYNGISNCKPNERYEHLIGIDNFYDAIASNIEK